MSGSTPFFGLSFFDFGDQLDAPLNVQKEIDRFVLIDTQLFGLYNVFGNGVIEGWIITDNGFSSENGISISIGAGTGIIAFIASETTFPIEINALPPNTLLNVYALLVGDTVTDRFVDFTVSTSVINSDFAIKIGEVTTGNSGVVSINNTERERIGFEQIIKEEIDAHRHRGTPSKINLEDEVKNQLPGAKIADLDAAKLTTGTFSNDQIPIIDHADLDNTGQLTHPQLDSFVKTLSESNRELLGEVSTTNVLRQIISQKYNFSDVDEHFINELAFIPGISPSTFVDLDATSAQVNNVSMCISGKPPATGEFLSVDFDAETAFRNAFKLTNVQVVGDTVIIDRDTGSTQIVEDFEGVSGPGIAIAGITYETVTVSGNASLVSEGGDSLKTEGFFSGKFSTDRQFRAVFTKEFAVSQDWTTFDQLVFDVKTISASHGAVFAYFVDGTAETQSDVFLLLSEDEVTSNATPSLNSFNRKTFDIIAQDRSAVSRIVIFTDDVSNGFEFFVDNIVLENTSLFQPQGTIRFRFDSSAPVTFHSTFYTIDLPEGTSASVRVKVANSASLLNRAGFTFPLRSGQVFARPGTNAEVEVTLISSDDFTLTPTLRALELRLLAASDNHGFNIDTESDWSRGTVKNIDIVPGVGDASLEIESPINVGGMYYSFVDAIRELDDGKVGVFGFSGNRMPISPVQAKNWFNKPFKKFEEPVGVSRQIDKNYVVADKDNDRVLEVDGVGNLVRGFASVNVDDETFYPFASAYNERTKVLTIVTSQAIDRASVDLTKISLFLGSAEIPLTATDTIISSRKSEQILEILMSDDKAAALAGSANPLTVNFQIDAFAIPIELNESSSALLGPGGIEVFVGDLIYMDGIRHPVSVNILENGNWIVGNSNTHFIPGEDLTAEATTEEEEVDPNLVAPILEFDPDTQETIFSSDLIEFSDFSLGAIIEQTDTRIVVAGVIVDAAAVGEGVGDGSTTDETTTTSTTTTSDTDVFSRTEFRQQARSKLASHRGIVVIIEKLSGSIVFKYTSPDGLYASDVDIDASGNLVIAESSFAAIAGRVIVLDSLGNIVRVFGNGILTVVNDARSIADGRFLLSV